MLNSDYILIINLDYNWIMYVSCKFSKVIVISQLIQKFLFLEIWRQLAYACIKPLEYRLLINSCAPIEILGMPSVATDWAYFFRCLEPGGIKAPYEYILLGYCHDVNLTCVLGWRWSCEWCHLNFCPGRCAGSSSTVHNHFLSSAHIELKTDPGALSSDAGETSSTPAESLHPSPTNRTQNNYTNQYD